MDLDLDELVVMLGMCAICLVFGALSFVAGVFFGWGL